MHHLTCVTINAKFVERERIRRSVKVRTSLHLRDKDFEQVISFDNDVFLVHAQEFHDTH